MMIEKLGRDNLLLHKFTRTNEEWVKTATPITIYAAYLPEEYRVEFRRKLNYLHGVIYQLEELLPDMVTGNEKFSEKDKDAALKIAPRAREYGEILTEIDSATDWRRVPINALAWFDDRIIANGGFWPLHSLLDELLNDGSRAKEGDIESMRISIYQIIQLGDNLGNLMTFFAYLKVNNLFAEDPAFFDFIPSAIMHVRLF